MPSISFRRRRGRRGRYFGMCCRRSAPTRLGWRGSRHVIAEFASGQVVASDIFDYGYGQAPLDFLHDEPIVRPEWIITNPPFNLACEFTLRALDLTSEGVAILARTTWIEGKGRFEKLFSRSAARDLRPVCRADRSSAQ